MLDSNHHEILLAIQNNRISFLKNKRNESESWDCLELCTAAAQPWDAVQITPRGVGGKYYAHFDHFITITDALSTSASHVNNTLIYGILFHCLEARCTNSPELYTDVNVGTHVKSHKYTPQFIYLQHNGHGARKKYANINIGRWPLSSSVACQRYSNVGGQIKPNIYS